MTIIIDQYDKRMINLLEHPAFENAVNTLAEKPEVVLVANANHLDNFTHWLSLQAIHAFTDQLEINGRNLEDEKIYNSLCDECYFKFRNDRYSNFIPSSSTTIKAICKNVYEKVRSK